MLDTNANKFGTLGMIVCLVVLAALPRSVAGDSVSFDQHVAPILAQHCTRCHGLKTKKGELDLSSLASLRDGSESGSIVSFADPDASRLLEVLVDGEMPPPDEGQALSAEQVDVIRRWIRGARHLPESQRELNQHDVLPILLGKCAECHGRHLREGDLDIRSLASLLQGGKSGPAVVPGEPNASLLIQRIAAGEMPPREKLAKYSVKPVTASELKRLEQWVAQGATWVQVKPDQATSGPDPLVSQQDRQHWAFRSPVAAAPPGVNEPISATCRNPIDLFIAGKLQERGLTFSPPADRMTLIRRLSFDLLGLPPTPEQVRSFVDNPHPLAYEQLADQLLGSPAYGERWAQYWLDLAGYADSEGVQHADPIRPHAYRYRDYVIQAFNKDKPYDRFVLEQVAGDELADYENAVEIGETIYDNLVATGFLRMTSDGTFAGITGFLPNRLDVIDDQLRVLSSAVMGITLRCARCHSHKFDPLPQRDYYRMVATFKGAMDEFSWLRPLANPSAGKSRYLPYVTTAERRAWRQRDDQLKKQIDLLSARLQKAKGESQSDELQQLEKRIAALEKQRSPEPMIRALWDMGSPSPTYLLRRGDYRQPTRLVGPGVPSMLTSSSAPFQSEPPWPGAEKTGNRLALAKWLVDPEHPLTARVMVNRIWKHHFGRGLHEPLDDFGKAAGMPSHPELLDWLAVNFVKNGNSIKWLHRQIVTSATYRQSSGVHDEQQRDPDNIWLSRMPLRRLEAEAVRDAFIAIADRLDHRPFGPGDSIEARADGLVTSRPSNGAYRRSIYVLKRRTQRLTILDNFDRPRMSPNCVDRRESTVAPQALHLMNNRMVRDLSIALAARIESEVGDDATRQIARLCELTWGRPPTAEQSEALVATLDQLARAWQSAAAGERQSPLSNVAHAVLNSAGFLYVD